MGVRKIAEELRGRVGCRVKKGDSCRQASQRAWNEMEAQFGEAIGLVAVQPEVVREFKQAAEAWCTRNLAAGHTLICPSIARPKQRNELGAWIWIGATAAGLWWLLRSDR